jgi:hypothetical protein
MALTDHPSAERLFRGVVGKPTEMVTMMKSPTKAWILLTLGWLAASCLGCGALRSHPDSAIVPISSFENVAGKWEGLSKHVPDMHKHAWVMLNVEENGTFTVVSNEGRAILLGAGNLTLIDGQLFGKTSKGRGTFTLHDRSGKGVLVVDAALNDANHYYVELTRAE